MTLSSLYVVIDLLDAYQRLQSFIQQCCSLQKLFNYFLHLQLNKLDQEYILHQTSLYQLFNYSLNSSLIQNLLVCFLMYPLLIIFSLQFLVDLVPFIQILTQYLINYVYYNSCTFLFYTYIIRQIVLYIIKMQEDIEIEKGVLLHLEFASKNLQSLDQYSESDPFIRIYADQKLIGQSRPIMNKSNVQWPQKLQIKYNFQTLQLMRFEVHDYDSATQSQLIGKLQITLAKIICSQKMTQSFDLKNSDYKITGELIIKIVHVENVKKSYTMVWGACNLANTDSFFDFWDKTDPFLVFKHQNKPICRTEFIKDNLNPKWRPISIPYNKLFQNNSKTFTIQCYDDQQQKPSVFVGRAEIKQSDLKKGFKTQILNQNTTKKDSMLQLIQIYDTPNIVDFFKKGLKFQMCICIDFTESNQNYKYKSSLHYIDKENKRLNGYQLVYQHFYKVINQYDFDKKFPAYGFGAKIDNTISHCFDLTNNLQISSLAELTEGYLQTLQKVKMSGPTNFSSILKQINNKVKYNEDKMKYFCILIMTDGLIDDFDETIKDLINLSCFAVSILIVGIGDQKFKQLKSLETIKSAQRDIVTIKILNDYKINKQDSVDAIGAQTLIKDWLIILEKQILDYMELKNIVP